MLIFILWMAIGMIGEIALGFYFGIKKSKLDEQCPLDEYIPDEIFNAAIVRTALEVIPLSNLALHLLIKGSKLWIPIGIFNNFCGWFMWPILLPKAYTHLNEVLDEVLEYIDYKREREGS